MPSPRFSIAGTHEVQFAVHFIHGGFKPREAHLGDNLTKSVDQNNPVNPSRILGSPFGFGRTRAKKSPSRMSSPISSELDSSVSISAYLMLLACSPTPPRRLSISANTVASDKPSSEALTFALSAKILAD
jgi:hypothetical protein